MDLNVTPTSEELAWDVAGELVEPNAWTSPAQVAIAALLVFLLSPVVLCSNALLLLSMYRFKRLRTPSNLFLVALFSADFGIGLLLPPGLYFEFSRPGIRCSALCLLPYCLVRPVQRRRHAQFGRRGAGPLHLSGPATHLQQSHHPPDGRAHSPGHLGLRHLGILHAAAHTPSAQVAV
ncbi:hypothetical protein MTO96_019410 [Rhipicephalus appendiculatus]